jgi:D-glycerate 3-kinase
LARESAAALPPLDPGLKVALALPLLQRLERLLGSRAGRLPLLAINGPVGAGKSTLVRRLRAMAAERGIDLAVASIDDAYLPWAERRRRLAGNPFGVDRVPPGSHDVRLLLDALAAWRAGQALRLPRFDKTLADGRGDRSGWSESRPDALLLEGWLMGCRPLGEQPLAEALRADLQDDGLGGLSGEEIGWLPRWDLALSEYAPLWDACDGLWVLRPERWSLPLRWRLQAEARQRRHGGGSLPAAEVVSLVRASLRSLPPSLYQDPLAARWASRHRSRDGASGEGLVEGLVVLDGRRRASAIRPSMPTGASQLSSASSSAIG